ncbi:uncharacterized protein LOC129261693 [Lytechinus pictus]|uniref:uncharacterized protein LOC129261693 n=1 Tax=Lytechinus pictus TaxID=7653 RepID=UPI0030BA0EF0
MSIYLKFIMPRAQRKRKAGEGKTGEGKAAASKKIFTKQAAEPMESETSQTTPEATATTATANIATATATSTTTTVNATTATLTATTDTVNSTPAQAGAAADEDPDDELEEALTQDQPDDEVLLPGDDQHEEGHAAAEDSHSQHPHLERDGEQQPHKKSRRKALLLDNVTQEQLFEWVREHKLLWRKGATDYKDTKKKTELWTRKARELAIEEGADALRTWWNSVRDLYAKLLSKKSGQAAANLTENCSSR